METLIYTEVHNECHRDTQNKHSKPKAHQKTPNRTFLNIILLSRIRFSKAGIQTIATLCLCLWYDQYLFIITIFFCLGSRASIIKLPSCSHDFIHCISLLRPLHELCAVGLDNTQTSPARRVEVQFRLLICLYDHMPYAYTPISSRPHDYMPIWP